MREHVLLPPARRIFDAAGVADQKQFDEIIDSICRDPSIDPPLKTEVTVEGFRLHIYNDGIYGVAYDLPDDATVRIWMIGVETDPDS